MKYNFESIQPRHGINSGKWDEMKRCDPEIEGKDIIPFSVADMEFEVAPQIVQGLKDYLDRYVLGYSMPSDGFQQAVVNWMARRHNWQVKPEWFLWTAGVVSAFYTAVNVYTQPGECVMLMTPCYYPMYHAITENGRVLVDNPMLSVDEVTLTLEYRVIPLYYQALDVVLRVSREHEKEFRSVYPATTRLEERALRLLDRAIAGGMIEAYPLKALLEASNNWATCVIVRPGLFRLVLLEGIGLGCLAPDKTLAWEWMETAAVNNDPATFMDDLDRYYDLLADAAENGVAEARRLMYRIWEPEQIIEED